MNADSAGDDGGAEEEDRRGRDPLSAPVRCPGGDPLWRSGFRAGVRAARRVLRAALVAADFDADAVSETRIVKQLLVLSRCEGCCGEARSPLYLGATSPHATVRFFTTRDAALRWRDRLGFEVIDVRGEDVDRSGEAADGAVSE